MLFNRKAATDERAAKARMDAEMKAAEAMFRAELEAADARAAAMKPFGPHSHDYVRLMVENPEAGAGKAGAEGMGKACRGRERREKGTVSGTVMDGGKGCLVSATIHRLTLIVHGVNFPFAPCNDAKPFLDLLRVHPLDLSRWVIFQSDDREFLACYAVLPLAAVTAPMVESVAREVGARSLWYMRRTGAAADTPKGVT